MYPAEFDYYRPKSLAEATALLRKHKESRVLAGGHSLLPAMRFRLATPKVLVDIGGIGALAGIKAKGKALEIGALATHTAVASSSLISRTCPILAETAAQIGDLQVRNRGTIGGSVAHADPAADYPTVLLALSATLTAAGQSGKREIPAEKFFVDLFTTALKRGEILTSVRMRGYGAGTGGAYVKHRHPASSYAVVGVAAIVEVDGGKCERVVLTVGGATAAPVRAMAAEKAFTGARTDHAAIAAAAAKVREAISNPLSDHYASGDFRVHLASVMARRALETAVARAKG